MIVHYILPDLKHLTGNDAKHTFQRKMYQIWQIFVSANKRAGRQGIMLEIVLSSYEKISEPFQINSIKKRLRSW